MPRATQICHVSFSSPLVSIQLLRNSNSEVLEVPGRNWLQGIVSQRRKSKSWECQRTRWFCGVSKESRTLASYRSSRRYACISWPPSRAKKSEAMDLGWRKDFAGFCVEGRRCRDDGKALRSHSSGCHLESFENQVIVEIVCLCVMTVIRALPPEWPTAPSVLTALAEFRTKTKVAVWHCVQLSMRDLRNSTCFLFKVQTSQSHSNTVITNLSLKKKSPSQHVALCDVSVPIQNDQQMSWVIC